MNVVLGVGGGIAAYKSAELARALMERGMRVQVVMTDAAREFITPLPSPASLAAKSSPVCSLRKAPKKLYRAPSNTSPSRKTTKFW